MSIRLYEDVVAAYNNYNDLMNRIFRLLMIYQKYEIIDVPKFEYLRVKSVKEDVINVELICILKSDVYDSIDIIDSMAGPPGLGLGWKPSGEDIIGSELVLVGEDYAVDVVMVINIPSNDIGIHDDSELDVVEKRYKAKYEASKKAEKQKRLEENIKKSSEEVEKMKEELKRFNG